jgi:beta-barrel assembly-enhancing protease
MSTYVPKPDVEGINAQPSKHPLLDLAVLLGGLIIVVGAVVFLLGSFGEWLFTRMSLETEMKLFEKTSISTQFNDTKIIELESLINKLQPHIPFRLKVSILCEEKPNALALPGGLILLTSGLFKTVHSENGLAFVLGHEIGHFINRDHMRGIGRHLMLQLFGSLAGFSMSEQSSSSLILDLSSKSFSRSAEIKADDYGLFLLQKVYGHSFGAEEFFNTLRSDEGAFENLMAFSSTHPLSSDRFDRVEKRQGPQKQKVMPPTSGFEHWLKQANCH